MHDVRRRYHFTLDEYERVRKDARHLVILPEHFVGDIERIGFHAARETV